MILISLVLITYQSFLRVFLFNSSIWFILLCLFLSISIFLKSFILRVPILNFKKDLYIPLLLTLFLSILKISTSNEFTSIIPLFVLNIYVFLYIAGAKFVTIFGVNKSFSLIKKWAFVIYIVDTLYIYCEVLSKYTNLLGFLNLYKLYFIEKIDPGRFVQVTVGTDILDFIDSLPIVLGPRGFPHYTAPLYLTASLILVLSSIKQRSLSRYFLITNTFAVLILLGVKTHIFVFVFVLCIKSFRKISLKININSFIYVAFMLGLVSLLYLFNSDINGLFNKWFDQIFYEQMEYITSSKDQAYKEPSRIALIFDYRNLFQIISRMNFVEFFIGTDDYSLEKLKGLSDEVAIFNFLYRFGFIITFSFFLTTIYSFINLIKSIKYLNVQNKNTAYLHSPLIFLPFYGDIFHFGQFLSQPDIAIAGLFLGYGASISPYLIQKQINKNLNSMTE